MTYQDTEKELDEIFGLGSDMEVITRIMHRM